MSTYVKYGIIFVSGLVLGAAASAVYARKKHYGEVITVVNDHEESNKLDDIPKHEEPKEDILVTLDEVPDDSEKEYIQYASHASEYKPKEVEEPKEIHTISPADYGECEYTMMGMTYFERDDILADDEGNIIDEEEYMSVVGDFKSHFGEYETDSVFVRNHRIKADYEILADIRSYNEVYRKD